MRGFRKSFLVLSIVVCLTATSVQARPTQDPGEPGIGTRIVQLIKHLVRVVLEDPSVPKP